MSLTLEQQIKNEIDKAKKPLIVFKKYFSGDSLAAAAALFLLLEKFGKKVDIACDGFKLPTGYKFIPAKDNFKNSLPPLRQMVISLSTAKTKVEEFHYDVTPEQLKIYLTPNENGFGPEDIRATISDWRYDLIITVDTPDLESLGEVYTKNREFFYARPIVNIDYSPANENFGQINLIDLTSSSTCGVIYNLIKIWDEKLFDPDINTCLLTGIIDKTKSFKAGMINPQTLQMSSNLIEQKARREEIVKHLYYNRDIATLKLWGKVLLKLQEEFNGKLITAKIAAADFSEVGASPDNLPDIIDEIISSIPSAELVVLVYENSNKNIEALVKSLSSFNPRSALNIFQPIGDKELIKIKFANTTLEEALEKITIEIKKNYKPNF